MDTVVGLVKSARRQFTPGQLAVGVAIGVIFSPLLWALFALFIPVLIFLGVVVAAAVAYAVVKLKATYQDWLIVKGAAVPRFQQIMAAKKNLLTDDFWYWRYQQQDKESAMIVNAEDDTQVSWLEMEQYSNRIANWSIGQKWTAGTTVGLFMPNRPEFVGVWLGMAKVGLRTALLNFNLRKVALTHSIRAGECKALIFDAELLEAVEEILVDLKADKIPLFIVGGTQELANRVNATFLQSELDKSLALAVPPEFKAAARGAKIDEPVLFIYTSGTTGLPKASKITHFRFRFAGGSFAGVFGYRSTDRLYCPLPLYHSAGGMLGVGAVFQSGCTLILRKKFSASRFSKDCKKHNVTCVQYIGELARYLLAAPEQPEDRQLNIRFAMGNGLRPDVWRQFKARFGIKRICEFYAATEGAAGLLNVGDVDFSIGYMSPILSLVAPMTIVKYDQEKEAVVRGPDGFCIRTKPGEAGEFIGKITKSFGVSNYSGYTNKEASDKKILRDVFVKGDAWFCSGDLLKMDENRNVFFVDRIGDTFRWKGENCATTEVAQIMGMFKGVPEANVYGVEVPHNDGRAGMAAIIGVDNAKSFDFAGLAKHLQAQLPRYAIPLFLRFMPSAEHATTSTFKHMKVDLRKAGFDINVVKDPLYFFDGSTYVPLTKDIFDGLQKGTIRV